jgi:hypothetical protein
MKLGLTGGLGTNAEKKDQEFCAPYASLIVIPRDHPVPRM